MYSHNTECGDFFIHDSLPLLVEVVIDPPVGDGHHDDEDPEQHHADQELVGGPHWNGRRLQVAAMNMHGLRLMKMFRCIR